MHEEKDYPAEYITFDNVTLMAAAAYSPHSFLTEHEEPVILDEVQMVPEIFRALKIRVDELLLKECKSEKCPLLANQLGQHHGFAQAF